MEKLVEDRDKLNKNITSLSEEKIKLEEKMFSINEELKLARGTRDEIQNQISEVG